MPTINIGFDTETVKGQVMVLGCSDGSIAESDNTFYLIDFLFRHGVKSSEGYNWFYNIAFDFSVIVKKFVVENFSEVHKGYRERQKRLKEIKDRITNGDEVTYSDLKEIDSIQTVTSFTIDAYRVKYIQGKSFSITRGKETRYFFDVSNFVSNEGHISLENASTMFLGKHKIDTIDRKRLGEDMNYFLKHKNEIIEYCIHDCRLTAELGENVVKAYEDIGIEFPKKPYSKASVSKVLLSKNKDFMESQAYINRIKKSRFYKPILRSFRGGIIDVKALGTYHNILELDVNSAYPTATMQLESLENHEIVFGQDVEKAFYRFYRVKTDDWTKVGLRVKKRAKDLVYSIDEFEFNPAQFTGLVYGYSEKPTSQWITGWDKDILDLYGIKYEILDSFGIKTEGKKLFGEISDFFNKKDQIKKEKGKDSIHYWLVKIPLNGLYGSFAQRKPFEGKYTNMIFATYVTGYCRYLIMKKAWEIEKMGGKVLQINTDGIYITGINRENIQNSDKLGEFSKEYYDKITIFGNGLYVKTKNNVEFLRKRGFENLKISDLKTGNIEINLKNETPIKLIQSIIQKKPEKIGEFFLKSKKISVFSLNYARKYHEKLAITDFRELFYTNFDLNYIIIPNQKA
jgi:hypothetical protein